MALEILEPGLSTTVQDRGRIGYYRFGIPQSGSMDQLSATIANRLVGNGEADAVLECTYMGPRLRTDAPATIAVTGAPVDVFVDGSPVEQWRRIELQPGSEVRFGVIRGGTRYYVAVAGGIDVPLALGSRSTYPIGRIGGFEGRALAAGDVVPVGAPSGRPSPEVAPDSWRPAFERSVEVRVVMGLYDHLLSDEGRRRLLEEEWKLTPVADRMGLRYSGPGVEWREREQPFGAGQDPSNIVDAGYAVGSVQIPGGTQPIVLHREAVSGGGYAMVATVISADMDVLARSAPGTATRFREVSMDEALEARRLARASWGEIWAG